MYVCVCGCACMVLGDQAHAITINNRCRGLCLLAAYNLRTIVKFYVAELSQWIRCRLKPARTFSRRKPWKPHIHEVGQNRTSTPYMTVYLVISLPKIPHIFPSPTYARTQ